MKFADLYGLHPRVDPLTDPGWICPVCNRFVSAFEPRETRILRWWSRNTYDTVIVCPNGCRPDAWIPAS